MRYHVGMIPDGNRRWAREKGLEPWEGHKKGAEKGELFIEWCVDHDEISEILEISTGTSKSQYFNAKAILRKSLLPYKKELLNEM